MTFGELIELLAEIVEQVAEATGQQPKYVELTVGGER
jgi:hypothetical protein